jgi:hypothetical protein
MLSGSDPFELSLSVAGIITRLFLNGLPGDKETLLAGWYSAFRTQDHQSGDQVDVWIEPGDPFLPFKPGPWLVKTHQRGHRLEFLSHLEKGWFNLAEKRGELVLRPEGNPENFLRVLYAWRCLAQDALLIHACGIIRNGGGYVFFGPSGSGKTTTARCSPGAVILSDDLVILQRERTAGYTAVRVYGVPFRGEMVEAGRANASARLVGLFTLVKDAVNRVDRVDRTEAVAHLAACIPFVMTQPENARRALALCEEISALVQVKALHFQPNAGFWEVIDG